MKSPFYPRASPPAPVPCDPLPDPGESELLGALGYPYLPFRVRHRPAPSWHPVRDADEIARYLYEAADGEPLFECIRFHLRAGHPDAPGKAFLFRSYAGGKWAWGLNGVETVIYRWPRVRAAVSAGERVYVVEGEKDVHALEDLGLTATTAPLGALQWTERHAEMLRGADVLVIPDNDLAGRVHAARVMASLRGRARCTAVIVLPVEPDGDVSDWLAAGNGAAQLIRLVDGAPVNPSPAEVAAVLELPPTNDLLASSSPGLRAALMTSPPAAPRPHPAFARSLSAFTRLGVAVRPSPGPADAGLPDAHATYRAVGAALRDASAAVAPLLADSSLLDRAAYELGLFAPLLRAALAEAPAVPPGEPDAPGTEFMTVPVARVVRTRWDWDAFVRDSGAVQPAETHSAWLLHLPPAGPLQVRRLQPLPALLLETCVRPMSRDAVADALAEQVQGDAARLRDVVHAQVDQMCTSGLLYARAGDTAGQAIEEMRTLLLADEAPRGGARSLVGVLARTLLAAREYTDAAAEARDEPYRLHRLDLTVDALEQMLDRVRGRNPFSAELDAYWAGTGIETRLRALAPLLCALERVLGGVRHSLPPVVVAQ